MSGERITISRSMVAVITVICFLAATGLLLWNPDEEMWRAGFVRVGLVMGALWLALPSRSRPAAWANVSPSTFVLILLAVFLVPRNPRLFLPLFLAVAAIGFVLRPRRRGRKF